MEEKPDKLNWIKEHYSLSDDFNINSFENWVPCHGSCNSKKSVTVFQPSPAFIAILDAVVKRGADARKRHDKLVKAQNRDKVIGRILIDLEKDNISKDDLITLLETTNEKAPEVGVDKKGHLFIHVSDRWKIINEPSNDLVMVSDGRLAGITPTNANPHISWMCPNCGSYGPWNGVMCMNCGMKSDPFD